MRGTKLLILYPDASVVNYSHGLSHNLNKRFTTVTLFYDGNAFYNDDHLYYDNALYNSKTLQR